MIFLYKQPNKKKTNFDAPRAFQESWKIGKLG
jgi:hypothetical protein